MKDIIIVAEKGKKNRKLLAMKNVDKTTMAKIAKVSSAMDLGSKYCWAINNADIDVTRDQGLIGIKKY